ncbi:MAG: septation regulator SpoVG [Lachnospiraceae bacterium]|nr:septation regulator SpoVG [Lachnospiraceae bacterium]
MEITDVRVRRLTNTGKMRALVSVTLDDVFVVHDIKIIEGEKGLFIAMPSRKASDGVFRDIAHPINTETRTKMQNLILERYQQSLTEPIEEVTATEAAPEAALV